MDYEKAYKEALERAKSIYNENPSSSTAKFVCGQIFPEIKESEDEKIRKEIIDWMKGGNTYDWQENKEKWIAYLEKQKEQQPAEGDNETEIQKAFREGKSAGRKEVFDHPEEYGLQEEQQEPAEWSEEFLRLMGITVSQDGNQVCVLLGENLAEGIAGFGDTLADAVEEFKKEWRQFDRFRKATWKPSEEQMEALSDAYVEASTFKQGDILESLYDDLKKL